MSIRQLLQANCEALQEQYHAKLKCVQELQEVLIEDILPGIADELGLDRNTVAWMKEWLEDTGAMFHISRRQEFTRSFAMESIRRTLMWRLYHLRPMPAVPPPRTMRLLPPSSRDPFGRPIIIMNDFAATENSERANVDDFKKILEPTLERLRVYLKELNKEESREHPILQYVIVLDLEGVSIQHINVELVTWILKEALPRFPGMLAAVFMYNYSWAHAGVWKVVQHLLPAPSLSRVFFPSKEDLISYFPPSSLPQEYGGTLPAIKHLRDPLRADQILLPPHSPKPRIVAQPSPPPRQRSWLIPPTSHLNPFFGYPTSRSSNSLYTPNRTIWQLVRTLVVLLWERWKRSIRIAFILLIFLLVVKKVRRQRRVPIR